MAGRSAKTSTDFLTTFDESKRETGIVAQCAKPGDKGRPITDVDLNAMQTIVRGLFRRHSQWGVRSGACHDDAFKVSGTGASNDITFAGPGSALDASPFYTVAGLPAIAPFASCALSTTADAAKDWLHAKCTHLAATKLTDTSKKWKPGALVGRKLFLKTGGTISSWDVLANGVNWATVSGTSLLASHAAGSRYWFGLSTPTGDRTDTVLLDTYEDEIAAVVATGDRDADPALNLNVGGAPLETTRRLAVRQSVFVSQGDTDDLALTASNDGDGTYSYVDTDNNVHRVVKLAQINRQAGVNTIAADDVEDLRTFAGRAVTMATRDVFSGLFDGSVTSSAGLAPSKNGGNALQLDIASGSMMVLGDRISYAAQSFTFPTGGTSWTASITYYAFVDANRRLVVKAALDSGASRIGKFTVNGGGTDLGTVTDERKFSYGLSSRFAIDKNGAFGASQKIKEDVPLLVYDKSISSPVLKGQLTYDPDTGVSNAASSAMALLSEPGVPAVFGNRTGSGGSADVHGLRLLPAASAPAWATGAGTGKVDLVTPDYTLDLTDGTYGPKAVGVRNIYSKGVLQAPGLIFGDSALAAAPVESNWIVPANIGDLSMDSRFGLNGTTPPIGKYYSRLEFYLDGGWTVLLPNSALPFYTLPLLIPPGTSIPQVNLQFHNLLQNGAELTLRVTAFFEDNISRGSLNPIPSTIASDTIYFQASGYGTDAMRTLVFDFGSGSTVLNARWIMIAFFLENSGSPYWVRASSGAARVLFKGVDGTPSMRAVGPVNTTMATRMSSPLLGMR